jgi:hypothetical protein
LAYFGVAAAQFGRHLGPAALGLFAVAIACVLFVAAALILVPPAIDASLRQDKASAIALAEAASARLSAHASFIELAQTLRGLWDSGHALWAEKLTGHENPRDWSERVWAWRAAALLDLDQRNELAVCEALAAWPPRGSSEDRYHRLATLFKNALDSIARERDRLAALNTDALQAGRPSNAAGSRQSTDAADLESAQAV